MRFKFYFKYKIATGFVKFHLPNNPDLDLMKKMKNWRFSFGALVPTHERYNPKLPSLTLALFEF